MSGRACVWCGSSLASSVRRDALTCSQRCRQARARFIGTVGVAPADVAPRGKTSSRAGRRFAYADPPYPGKAFYYVDHPDYGGEVNHVELIRGVLSTYDGWALSTSAEALPVVLASCPPGVRVAAWVRGARASSGWLPLSSWEPVVYFGARPLDPSNGDRSRVDSLVHGVTPLTTFPGRVMGTKPAAFSRWLFDLLGLLAIDDLTDLFPGSGLVERAWSVYASRSDLEQVSCRTSLQSRGSLSQLSDAAAERVS